MRTRSLLLYFIAAAGAVSCSDVTTPVSTSTNASKAVASISATGPTSGYVSTPAGWYHKSCVYEIPDGGRVNAANRVVTRRDGTTYHLSECAHPAYPNWPQVARARRISLPPVDTGWVEYAYEYARSGQSYLDLEAAWHVPRTPDNSYSATEVFYAFPGL